MIMSRRIPYVIDQTPWLLLISARDVVRLLFESGVYFVQRLHGYSCNLQRDTGNGVGEDSTDPFEIKMDEECSWRRI